MKHPAVVLISDLADDNNDSSRLNDVLTLYKHDGIKLYVVPLNAAPRPTSTATTRSP